MFELKVIAKGSDQKLVQEYTVYAEDVLVSRTDPQLIAYVEKIKSDIKETDPDIELKFHMSW